MNLTVIIIITIVIFAIAVIAGLAIVNFSFDELMDKFNEVSQYPTAFTPIDLAKQVSNKYFSGKIKIRRKKGKFCDSYSSSGILTLSSDYANSKNVAVLAICAHELGHAFQFKNSPQKMKKFVKKVNFNNILSKFITPTILVGIVLVCFNKLILAGVFAGIGVVIFIMALLTKLSTIKIEKEASENAILILKEFAYLTATEIEYAKKFLDSAKQTYIADLLKSMLKWTFLTKN